jgi:hypothetical protein
MWLSGVELGGVGLSGGRRGVVAVQVIPLHEADQLCAVIRVGGIHTGQRISKRIRIMALGHGLRVVLAGGQQLAVVFDALGDIAVHPKWSRERHELAILVLLSRLRIAARRAIALNSEQIVVSGRQAAQAPAGLIDGLGNRHRRGDAVLALRGHRARRDRSDK